MYINQYHCDKCNVTWTDGNCDSMHNDHCPACDAEIEPEDSEWQSDDDGTGYWDKERVYTEMGIDYYEDNR